MVNISWRRWIMREQSKMFKLCFGAMFVALNAIGANITSIVPFIVVGGVLITLQTFFAVLACLVLGSGVVAFISFVYMMLGLVGDLVFAQFKGGMVMLLSPTFGFILSFILIAYVACKIREVNSSFPSYIAAALVAMTINYVFGTNRLYVAYQFWFEAPPEFSYNVAWLWILATLPKDIILTVAAGVFAYRLEQHGITIRKPVAQSA